MIKWAISIIVCALIVGGLAWLFDAPAGPALQLVDRDRGCTLSGGRLTCWGGLEPFAEAFPAGVTRFAIARRDACAQIGEQVRCWTSRKHTDVPPSLPAEGLRDLHMSQETICGLFDGGDVACAGRAVGSKDGWLPVVGVSQAEAIGVHRHGLCMLHHDGRVSCPSWWEAGHRSVRNHSRRRGDTIALPYVVGLSDAVRISVGRRYACAARANGEVQCWQPKRETLCKRGLIDCKSYGAPRGTPIDGVSEPAELAAGSRSACARVDGTVYCWRRGEAAKRVEGLPPVDIIASARDQHCALADGALWCWTRKDPSPKPGPVEPRKARRTP